jgi:hypothetical protein
MKTRILLVTFSLLFFVVATSAQEDCYEKFAKKVLEADSLKRHINSLDNLIKEKNEAINSLKKEIIKQNEFNKKQEKFKTEQEKFEIKQKTEQDKLKTDKKEFEKKQEETRKSLKQKSDSIVTLNDSLIKSKREQERLSSEKFAEGRKHGKEEVISYISQYYKKPFDQLAKSTTTGSITQYIEDLLRRFDNQNEALKIVQNILIYKEAEQLLHHKYDSLKVNDYLGKLDSIGDSKSAQDLKKLLKYFEFCNSQFVIMIKTIQKTEPSHGNELIKNKIENDMWNKIGRCLFDYDIENYPYLRGIVFELIYLKQKNAEADVSDLLKKL